jgi:hypothetical protein
MVVQSLRLGSSAAWAKISASDAPVPKTAYIGETGRRFRMRNCEYPVAHISPSSIEW